MSKAIEEIRRDVMDMKPAEDRVRRGMSKANEEIRRYAMDMKPAEGRVRRGCRGRLKR
jgi:hypothetical protein